MGIFDMVKKMNPESRIFGFLMGPHGVYSGNYIEICAEYMSLYRNMGGFDMICKASRQVLIQIKVPAAIKLRPLSNSQAHCNMPRTSTLMAWWSLEVMTQTLTPAS